MKRWIRPGCQISVSSRRRHPLIKATRDVKKFVIGLAGGGLGVGIAIALLIELVLDRTVKRSLELETRLAHTAVTLDSQFRFEQCSACVCMTAGHDSELVRVDADIVAMESGDLLRPFCEAIRDRLGLFFELNHMAHKPKLVAVTGLAKNAGASTLAAGLANTLSEGTEGKVLLVDKPSVRRDFTTC